MKKFFSRSAAMLMASAIISTAGISAAAETTKKGVIPSVEYSPVIYTVDDYLLAVKKTACSNEEIRSATEAAENYVPYVDNSKLKYFPKIRSQIGPTCIVWGSVYYQFTHQVNRALDREATDANTMNPVFTYNLYTNGSWKHPEELLNTAGCASLSLVPDYGDLKSWHTGYEIWREALNYRCSSYMQFAKVGKQDSLITSEKDTDLDVIKACLRNGEVFSCSAYCDADKKWFETTKIPEAPGVDKELVGQQIATKVCMQTGSMSHMLCIVGYNDNIWVDINKNGRVDQGEKGALKIANSWGETFGNKGFIWLAYDALNEQSIVEGVGHDSDRMIGIESNYYKINVSKNYNTSGIYLYYKLNTENRSDNYVEIVAKRKSNGVTYIRKVSPYNHVDLYSSNNVNYEGTNGAGDGAMVADLNTVVAGLNSDNFNDYEWSIRFVDKGTDSSALTVKEAFITDENKDKTYRLGTAFPFQVNASIKTVSINNYYHFSKLTVPSASELTAGNNLTFTFKTANETFGNSPIVYTMTVYKGGKQVFYKKHKATTINRSGHYSVIKGSWKPSASGTYTVFINGTDASGTTISRSATFKVYSSKLAVRSIDLDKGKYIDQGETLKIKPLITGGTAPYTYSYYYIKGGKTVKIAENSKSTYKTKTFGLKTGKYTLLVKVKDAKGNTAQATQCVVVEPTAISRLSFSSNYSTANTTNIITAETSNLPVGARSYKYSFVIEKDGAKENLEAYTNKVEWTPKSNGTYHITCTLKTGNKVLAKRSMNYLVGTIGTQNNSSKNLINVNVITYVCNEAQESGFTIHYWGGKDGAGDVKCVPLSTTKVKNVGLWSTAQTFKQYVAEIPKDATGYKFHIGDRWFPASGGDGNTATSNTVYVFNYNYDRCIYNME